MKKVESERPLQRPLWALPSPHQEKPHLTVWCFIDPNLLFYTYTKHTHLHLTHSIHSVLPLQPTLNVSLTSFHVSTCWLDGILSLNTLLTMTK